MQEIKSRIESIGVTRQISQAMKLVSNSKIQRARALVESARPFFEESRRLLARAVASAPCGAGAYCGAAPGPPAHTLYVVVGSDRGLCGGYNLNVGKHALAQIQQQPGESSVLAVGIKVRDYFARRRIPLAKTITGVSQNPFYSDARDIGDYLLAEYGAGRVQQVVLVYTEFTSMLNHVPRAIRLLPLDSAAGPPPETPEPPRPEIRLSLEPDEETLLDALVPGYLYACVFGALAEGSACEQSARITSMDSAVKNSGDLIDKLQLKYNQARQDAITQELNEIVSGAEAMR